MTDAPVIGRRSTSTIAGSFLSVLAAAVLLTSCLGPTDRDPTGNNPFGSLDSIVADGDGVRGRSAAGNANPTTHRDEPGATAGDRLSLRYPRR